MPLTRSSLAGAVFLSFRLRPAHLRRGAPAKERRDADQQGAPCLLTRFCFTSERSLFVRRRWTRSRAAAECCSRARRSRCGLHRLRPEVCWCSRSPAESPGRVLRDGKFCQPGALRVARRRRSGSDALATQGLLGTNAEFRKKCAAICARPLCARLTRLLCAGMSCRSSLAASRAPPICRRRVALSALQSSLPPSIRSSCAAPTHSCLRICLQR